MDNKKEMLVIRPDGFCFAGEKFDLQSGDVHYFRIYPTAWKRHLTLAKEFGLNTIQTYVPWNLHEPKKGQFDFDGILDLCAFLELAQEMGLKVLLRPCPYLCSECDFGGLPAWLLQEELAVRSHDPRYLKHVADYYDVLIPKILPYLSTKGGPVLMVTVENEYGDSCYDKKYLQAIADMLIRRGVDVPLYTTDCGLAGLHMGTLPGVLPACNFRSAPGNAEHFYAYLKKHHPQWPFLVGELWGGRQIHWGEPYHKRDPQETVEAYAESLERGSVNFYMFSGGTNFGFFSGGLYNKSFSPREGTPTRYIAHTTSYDEDAPVSENGLPTEKYYQLRNALLRHRGLPENNDRTLPFEYKTQSLTIKLTETARLFDNLDALTERKEYHVTLPTMEKMKQETGFMLYSTDIEGWAEAGEESLIVEGVRDRVTIYDGEAYVGKIDRDREHEPFLLDATDRTIRLDLLTESVARINGGKQLYSDPKGITGYVAYAAAILHGWDVRTLPMRDLSGVQYKALDQHDFRDNDPAFFKGAFDAQAGVDTFLDMRGWGRGFVVVNGFNLGRFWEIGPQYTLYLPGGLLKDKDNEIIIFDVNRVGKPETIQAIEEHILEGD